jgi:hypothetical protein
MNARDARDLARKWVAEEAARMPGFAGAYFAGSTNALADDAELPPGSDIDVMVVFEGTAPPEKVGKFLYGGALLEASNVAFDRLAVADTLLRDHQLAHAFRTPCVIADPSGRLTEIQAVVARDFAKRRYVEARCQNAFGKVRSYLEMLDETKPLHEQVGPWLFGTSNTTLVLLIAGLRNPTVRRRYAAVRELLAEHNRLDVYEELLGLFGAAGMSRGQVERHLAELARMFDATKVIVKTPVFFASDISDAARPITFEGSHAMIEAGLHREAVFWIGVTFSRCRAILSADAPDLIEGFDPAFHALLADLGIDTSADRSRGADEVMRYLPRLNRVADDTMAATPGIEDDRLGRE